MVKGQRICSLVLSISLMLCFGGSGVAFAEGDYLTPCEETVHLTYPAVIWPPTRKDKALRITS